VGERVEPGIAARQNGPMQYGVILTTGDPRTAADLAAEAEAACWDGVFTYDAVAIDGQDLFDPWVVLAAMAMRTRRVRLGAVVFAPARRRPWGFAHQAITLDVLSNGRLVLPVGLGALDDKAFGNVGEPTDARVRAGRLDETLAIVEGLGSGQSFAFEGEHYRLGPMALRPAAVQRPRIPVWVVGAWPHERSMRRAVRWDGIVVQASDADGRPAGWPELLPEIVAWCRRERPPELRHLPFEVIVDGVTPADDRQAATATVLATEEAGATWWLEADWANVTLDALRARILAGPPRVG
jgi:alkanesulfonate monooxygenase SsuD/methylene tetrahydromethanopterin reductase-like flavin-dependent oxidoreductase (luciferase family)